MPLDLYQVTIGIQGLVSRLKAEEASRAVRLHHALQLARSVDIDRLKKKIEASKTTWLVAGLKSSLMQRHTGQPCPVEYTALATDGSHIDVDRHSSLRCALINIGNVALRYGHDVSASLETEASLLFGDELFMSGPAGHQEAVEGALLGARRSVDELEAMARLAHRFHGAGPLLALVDGSLIMWGVQAFRDFIADKLLRGGFLKALDALRDMNVALAGFISYPRSTDVVNTLRVALCPHDPADCDRHCANSGTRSCDAVAGIQDRELFQQHLEDGERSPLFLSGSTFMQKNYGEHQIYFFYLKLEDEIVRVEMPRWVARDERLVSLVHSLVLDQCRRGDGYPSALMEAHEKAVVTIADRERFWQLVEQVLCDDGIDVTMSGKRRSKLRRWV